MSEILLRPIDRSDGLAFNDFCGDQPISCGIFDTAPELTLVINARTEYRQVLKDQYDPAWTRLALMFSTGLDEDALDTLHDLVAYAWKTTGSPDKPADNGVQIISDLLVIYEVDLSNRKSKTRTPGQALSDFALKIAEFAVDGSPVRRDGTQALEGLGPDYAPQALLAA